MSGGKVEAGPPPVDVASGGRLRELRIEAGLTREEMAHGVGLASHTVLEHETGRRRMTPVEIVRYRRFLGVHLSAFLPRAPSDRTTRQTPPMLYQIWP